MRQLIAANWKMNGMPDWAEKVRELGELTKDATAERLICPSHPLIHTMTLAAEGSGIAIGAQDCAAFTAGAHTGETDAALISALGAHYVILGHSERRAGGESSADVQNKAAMAIKSALRPIICVGESLEQREGGEAQAVVRKQLRESLPEEGSFDVAYEPIWAIGTGKTATVDDIAEMHATIRENVAEGTRILYGGSVKPSNAEEILSTSDVGGALVGGASLQMESFSEIILASKG